MTIEFQCPACHRPLRVPDEVAGMNGKCPQCATIFVVPYASTAPGPGPGSQQNPFADEPGVNPYDVGGIPARHFPGLGPDQQFSSETPVIPQPADVSVILSLSFSLWQRHLGLLVGTTLVTLLFSVFMGILHFNALAWLVTLPDWESGLAYHLAQDALQVTNFFVQTFFWTGQTQICLRLARNQPVEFADLFLGGGRFFHLLGAWLLVLTPVYAVNYGVLYGLSWGNTFGDVDLRILWAYGCLNWLLTIFFAVMFWPFPYLVLDRKTSILESYFAALLVTDGNRWTTVLLALTSFLILLVGYLACFIGLLFATPLVFMLWSVAYLMMAGQIPSYNWAQQPSVYR